MSSVEELRGLIDGLTQVVKGHLSIAKSAQGKTDSQLNQLAQSVSDLRVSLPTCTSSSSSSNSSLRLPQITLPTFHGKPKEDLERFLEKLTNLLQPSGVPSQHFVTYLKQQLLHDSRAYDIVCKAEEEHASLIELTESSSVVTPKQYLQYFNAIKETLVTKRGKPKEDKIRDLLDDYHSLWQGPNETIPQFSQSPQNTTFPGEANSKNSLHARKR